MPGKLINNTLSSLTSGVSQQYEEARFDSQVSEMYNCIPHLTRGVLRRNPTRLVKKLDIPTIIDYKNSFIYAYDRGTPSEQYIIVIPGDGNMFVFNSNTGIKEDTLSNHSKYLMVPHFANPKKCFKALTIGDHTFIINNTVTVKKKSITNPFSSPYNPDPYKKWAFYWIKKTASVVSSSVQKDVSGVITTGSKTKGYIYNINGFSIQALTDTTPGRVPPVERNTTDAIAKIAATTSRSGLDTNIGAFALTKDYKKTTFSWSDGFANEASLGVWKTIDDPSKLPASLPALLEGFIVKVTGGSDVKEDDYYLEYRNNAWKEIPNPDDISNIEEDTMPHVIYRLQDSTTAGKAKFHIDTYQKVKENGTGLTGQIRWGKLVSGNAEGNFPSFMDKKINNIFFFRNRLGFLTNDNLLLSQNGDYGNFFPQTVREVLDDDVIDLAIASTDVSLLRKAIPIAGKLIVFSDDTQFLCNSGDQPFTAKTAQISVLSNYSYNENMDAVAVGNRVIFSNVSGDHASLYEYKANLNNISEVNPLTVHLPTYFDKKLTKIVGHDVLGYTFILSDDHRYRRKIYVLNSVEKGNKQLQNAFHTWTFQHDILSCEIINNRLYIIFHVEQNHGFYLTSIDLEIPRDIKYTTYQDAIITPANTNHGYYNSFIKFSEFFIRDSNGKGSIRGRYQIRSIEYTITEDSIYQTSINNKERFNDLSTGNYTRVLPNDKKVTIMDNSKMVEIIFSENHKDMFKGFELATVNVEGYYHQRSARM